MPAKYLKMLESREEHGDYHSAGNANGEIPRQSCASAGQDAIRNRKKGENRKEKPGHVGEENSKTMDFANIISGGANASQTCELIENESKIGKTRGTFGFVDPIG